MAVLPTERHCKKLDPKLRRITQTYEEPVKLRRDLEASVVRHNDFTRSSTGEFPDIEVTATEVYKRCLVRHREIPAEFETLDWHSIVDGISTVSVPLHRLDQLAQSSSIDFIEAGRNFSPMLNTSVAETRADAVHQGAIGGIGRTGAGVIVGIIDSPLDFTLDDFRNDDGTSRIAFIWDQGLNPQANETSPANFSYGVEYDSSDIDGSNLGTGAVRHSFGVSSHGTHVAGIAAGNGRSTDATFAAGEYVGVAPEATIIYVNPDSGDQNSSFTDSTNVADAISYIYGKAEELGMPCVINMSLGQNGGSHDGESIVERAIDRLLETPGRSFVSAAGNEHIWRGHSSGLFVEGETTTLRWKAGGGIPWPFNGGNPLPEPQFGDFTPNELEIWFSSRDTVRVRVVSPGGLASDWVTTDESESTDLANGNAVFLDVERFSILNGDSRIYIEIEPITQLVEEGVWLVEIEPLNIRDARYDGFIERDARMHRVPLNNGTVALNFFADQSFFAGDDFVADKTLGTPATSRRGIAVANYNHVTESLNESSSRGRTRDNRDKPEVAAPGTNIFSANSQGGQQTPNGDLIPVRIDKTGTSMSAPHVAGVVALLLQTDPRLTAEQIRKILIAGAVPRNGSDDFDNGWGYGALDAARAVELVP